MLSNKTRTNIKMIPTQQQGLFRPIHASNFRSHLHFLLPRLNLLCMRPPQSVKSSVNLEKLEVEEALDLSAGWTSLKQKVEVIGIEFDHCIPGEYTYMICPKVLAEDPARRDGVYEVNLSREMTEETLRLEPLGDELIDYFAERMISMEVLQKNAVMQPLDNKNVIAFTYRKHGKIVNCKYRSITSKKYWQLKGAERILYGLDDLKEGDDIVIVEGEIDKLSMEQAGILNCVSVPDGAPQKVSTKEVPSIKQDMSFKYLWNCKEYLDKASRIILATDGDGPGQVLAEELARRLGRERCWIVTWPKKDEFNCYKDANEVLKHLGAKALRDVIRSAELYQGKHSCW